MSDKQVTEPLPGGRFQVLFFGHHRERADVRSLELGIVVVVMIVGASPDAARAQRQHSKDLHDPLSQARRRQNRMMLLIVVNDEKPENQQSFQDTERQLARRVRCPEGASDRASEEDCSG